MISMSQINFQQKRSNHASFSGYNKKNSYGYPNNYNKIIDDLIERHTPTTEDIDSIKNLVEAIKNKEAQRARGTESKQYNQGYNRTSGRGSNDYGRQAKAAESARRAEESRRAREAAESAKRAEESRRAREAAESARRAEEARRARETAESARRTETDFVAKAKKNPIGAINELVAKFASDKGIKPLSHQSLHDDIKKAYRVVASLVHPDRNPHINPDLIKGLNAAFDILKGK